MIIQKFNPHIVVITDYASMYDHDRKLLVMKDSSVEVSDHARIGIYDISLNINATYIYVTISQSNIYALINTKISPNVTIRVNGDCKYHFKSHRLVIYDGIVTSPIVERSLIKDYHYSLSKAGNIYVTKPPKIKNVIL